MKRLLLLLCLMAMGAGAYAQTPIRVQDVYANTDSVAPNDTSTLNGQTVTVFAALVTDPTAHFRYDPSDPSARATFWIQDTVGGANSGLLVTADSQVVLSGFTSDPTTLAIGATIEVTGEVDYFQGNIQLNVTNGDVELVAPGIVNLPAAPELDMSMLSDGGQVYQPSAHQYESVPIMLTNVDVTGMFLDFGFEVQDQNGNEMLVLDSFSSNSFNGDGPDTRPQVGTRIDTLRGLGTHFVSGSNNKFELLPVDSNDVVIGSAPPQINDVTRSTVCPGSSNPVKITASTSHPDTNDGVKSVVLNWGTGPNPSFQQDTMALVSPNTWESDIPAQSQGTLVSYFVEAIDSTGATPGGPGDMTQMPRGNTTPFAYTTNDAGCRIADIQRVPNFVFSGSSDFWESGYRGMTVSNVTGVVTASVNDLGSVFIQDPNASSWAGIWLQGLDISTLNTGDSVVIQSATVVEEGTGMSGGAAADGQTYLDVSTLNNLGPANNPVQPVQVNASDIEVRSVQSGASFQYDQEKWEAMLVEVTDTNLAVVQATDVEPNSTFESDVSNYRVGLDPADPLNGFRVQAGVDAGQDYSSLNVSFVNDSSWTTTAGTMTADSVCVVNNQTTLDAIRGIFVYQWFDPKLLPRTDADFTNIQNTSCDQVTGRADELEAAADLRLFPNPTNGDLNLRLDGKAEALRGKVTLLDLAGRRVLEEQVNLRTGEAMTLQVGKLEAGTYIVRIAAENGATWTNKLIKLD